MAERLTPDLCVIGAGSGGLEAAAGAASFGASVVLIEMARMGGSWLNTGTVPATAFLAAAQHARSVARATSFGAVTAKPTIDFGRIRAHIQEVTKAVAPNAWKERFTGLGVRVIEGTARFKDRRTVAVGQDTAIEARGFVIATGSRPASPSIDGLAALPHLDEETIFHLNQTPRHLVVIGAEPTALELAQAFRLFGARVTVLDAMQPLASEDPECARIVLDQFARDGIAVRSDVAVRRVEEASPGIRVLVSGAGGEEKIEGSDLLVATARQPNVASLDLDRARIKYSPRGIIVDRGLRTSNRRVYAIGDVIGGPRSTQAARHQAHLVVRNALFRHQMAANDSIIPRVIRTHPELAHVGLTEAEARRAGRICVLRWPFREIDRAQAERDLHGHIKVITDGQGRVCGATIVGEGAGELIAVWSLAVAHSLDIASIARAVVPSSALAEIGKRAAATHVSARAMSPWRRRILRLLRRRD